MGIDARAHERHAGTEDEVSPQALPHEVELVSRPPHVDPGGGQSVGQGDGEGEGRKAGNEAGQHVLEAEFSVEELAQMLGEALELHPRLFDDLSKGKGDAAEIYRSYLAERDASYMQLESGSAEALAPPPSAEVTGYDRDPALTGDDDRVALVDSGENLDQLTLYAFSEENWKRPRHEVRLLMRLLRRFLVRERGEIMDNSIRLQAIGRISRLFACCSIMWAHHPVTRDATKIGVYCGTGMPITKYVMPHGKSTLGWMFFCSSMIRWTSSLSSLFWMTSWYSSRLPCNRAT